LPSYSYTPTPTPAIYTLSLHDALPIFPDDPVAAKQASFFCSTLSDDIANTFPISNKRTSLVSRLKFQASRLSIPGTSELRSRGADRKSTRLNSSHLGISYAVFCLKKKK